MAKQDLETRLRLAIKEALGNVTKANSPAVFGFFHRDDGTVETNAYNRLENMIIEKIIATEISIDAAVPQIENELNLM